MRARTLTSALAALTACFGGAAAAGETDPFKAAIVYNFSRFAEWAPNRFEAAADPIVLCVEPSDPMAESLAAMDGKPVGARHLKVKKVNWPFGSSCHIGYVSHQHADATALNGLSRQGVLSVGETPDFAEAGAIRLIVVGRQVRFEINNQVATAAGAKLSSQLLRLAVKVR